MTESQRTRVTRRVLLVGSAASAAAVAAGCTPEWTSGVLEETAGAGQSTRSGDLLLRNVVAVSAVDGLGTLLMTIVNEGPEDALVAVQLEGGRATVSPQPSTIPAGGITVYGVDTSQTLDPHRIVLRGEPVDAGYVVQVVFVFRRAAPLELGVLVVPHEGPYRNVPVPTAQP